MRSRSLATTLLALMAVSVRHEAHAGDILSSAPIDAALFRDGEVQRSVDVHGHWTLICDSIPRLGNRFCSMVAAPVNVGSGTVTLTISTGDDGRPAALLRLPFGLSLSYGVRIGALRSARNEPQRRVPVALCSATACEAVWSLSQSDIAALRVGPGLRLSVRGWRFNGAGRQGAELAPVSATVDGIGFSDAVTASTR